jgi:Icc-related predicted phosphoesterase
MGSKKLQEILESQNGIFLNVHGHSHNCRGYLHVNGKTVCNPGAVKDGNYAII